MSKATKLSHKQWARLKTRLTNDYSPSVMTMRGRMRDVLGFTPRVYTFWSNRGTGSVKPIQMTEIHLDWFNEPKRTMFLLKYGEYLETII